MEHKKVVDKHEKEIIRDKETNAGNTSELVQYNDLRTAVAGILERLPERCGKIFCMNRFEGMTYTDIAVRLGISVKTVEADMSKALKEFRIALKEK